MADDKPKARPRLKTFQPSTEEQGKKPTPNPLPSSSKPTVNHAPKRKPYPSTKEPKKPAQKPPKEPLKAGIKKGVEAAKRQAKQNYEREESVPFSSRKRGTQNPTNATVANDTETSAPKTVDELLANLIGPLALQLPEVNANLRGRRPKINQLTPKTLGRICLMIRAGAYHQDAARAAGVHEATWTDWLSKGRKDYEDNKNTAYCQLFLLIDKSIGEAITAKSIEAVTADPKFYLTHGPGKTRPGREGWSPSIKIEGGNDPIRVEHEHGGKIEIEGSPHLTINLTQAQGVNDVAEAFANLQELGIVIPQKLLESMKQPIPVDAKKG